MIWQTLTTEEAQTFLTAGTFIVGFSMGCILSLYLMSKRRRDI